MVQSCKLLSLLLLILFTPIDAIAHDSWEKHAKDVMDVFGFEWDGRKANKNTPIKKWIEFISSKMIDDTSFHRELMNRHNGFPNLATPQKHRILFHWAYDAKPWNIEFEKIVKDYCYYYDLNEETNIRIFKSELENEQVRRNRNISRETGYLFGQKYEYFFSSMAYNVHILGDYMSDNSVLTGLNELTDLMGKIIIELRKLDYQASKPIVREINNILHNTDNVQIKADKLMKILTTHVPKFLKDARKGDVYRTIGNRGFVFKEIEEENSFMGFLRTMWVKFRIK